MSSLILPSGVVVRVMICMKCFPFLFTLATAGHRAIWTLTMTVISSLPRVMTKSTLDEACAGLRCGMMGSVLNLSCCLNCNSTFQSISLVFSSFVLHSWEDTKYFRKSWSLETCGSSCSWSWPNFGALQGMQVAREKLNFSILYQLSLQSGDAAINAECQRALVSLQHVHVAHGLWTQKLGSISLHPAVKLAQRDNKQNNSMCPRADVAAWALASSSGHFLMGNQWQVA